MKIKTFACVHNADNVSENASIKVKSDFLRSEGSILDCSDCIAYPPFINSHDHLISNWFPKAGEKNPFPNVDIWVEEMKNTKTFLERNKVWINDGSFDLTKGTAKFIILLGIYKNLFSGCAVVQDHIPNQKDEYYENNPITILKEYTQCHSLSMGNWWGGKTAVEEWKDSQGEKPFIIHIGEGIDDKAKLCFPKLEELDLLKPNTLLIHGIALSREQLKKCADVGSSICWCPDSNLFLVGKTLDIESCLEFGVNVVIGTDSTMSGSINILEDIKTAKKNFPDIPIKEIFRMVTSNAAKALFLKDYSGQIKDETAELLLIKKKNDDPFRNLLEIDNNDIELFIHKGIPIYGNQKFLDNFKIELSDYFLFENRNVKKFVFGHPEKVIEKIDSILGYHKNFPFLPF